MTSLLELQGKLSSCNGSASVWRRKLKHNLDDVREPSFTSRISVNFHATQVTSRAFRDFSGDQDAMSCLPHDDHDKDHSVASSQLVDELERETTLLSETIQD